MSAQHTPGRYSVTVTKEAANFIEFMCMPSHGWTFRLHVVRATGAAYVKTRTGKHASAIVAAKRIPELCAAVAPFIVAQQLDCTAPRAAIAKATGESA